MAEQASETAAPGTAAPETVASGTAAPETVAPAARWRRGPLVALAVLVVLGIELVLGWSSLVGALTHLRAPKWGWVAGAVVAEVGSMRTYARMQRALLRGAGTKVEVHKHVAVAYAAHSLSATLPGGPVFSTSFNFQHMRRFGASAAVASWCIALSGVLSTGALVAIGAVGSILTHSSGGWRVLIGYGVGALALAAAVRMVAQHPEWLDRPVRALLGGLNRLRRRPADHGHDQVLGFVDQLRAVRVRPANYAMAIALALANWLLDALCLWMCCVAVGAVGIDATNLVIAYCAGMAAASVPIIPGGLGIVDGALVLGLVAGGLSSSSALTAVVLYRLISFGFTVGSGWLIWLLIRYRTHGPFAPARH